MSEVSPSPSVERETSVVEDSICEQWNRFHLKMWVVLGSAHIVNSIANVGLQNEMKNQDIQAVAFVTGLSLAALLLRARNRLRKAPSAEKAEADGQDGSFENE